MMHRGQRLRSITNHILTRPALVPLRSFIATRKTTSIIFCVSIIILAACLISIWNLYVVDKPNTQVTIMPGPDLVVRSVYVRLKHNVHGRDQLILDVQLRPNVENLAKPILLLIVPRLSPLKGRTGSTIRSSSIPDYYRYELKGDGSDDFHEEFEGNIFGKSVQELNLDFNLTLGNTTFGVEKISQRIYVEGIGDSNVVTVYPQPTLRYPLLIGYEYTPGPGKESPHTIKMTAIDRSMIYKTQFIIFTLGMLGGIFASVLATIITDFVKHIEMDENG